MIDEFETKINIYKITGETEYLSDIPKLTGFLSEIKEIKPTTIKSSACTGNCRFKFKGTESQLRNFISAVSKLSFKVKKVRKVLF